MLYNPENLIKKEGRFIFKGETKAVGHEVLADGIFAEFWHGFSFHLSTLSFTETNALCFQIGEADLLPLDGYDYTVNITARGVSLSAKDEQNLRYAYMSLIDRICLSENEEGDFLYMDACEIRERALIERRMVHFCIFPETTLFELHRYLRMCAALRYTHVVLEFWGMYRFDCRSELSWPFAYTKEELAPILSEARTLGLSLIPMFNHWGHASGCRVCSGKHVMLDQDPSLQGYFSDNGWCWAIEKPKVRLLLRQVREELCALCGDGEYFHIGCDEAYGFDVSKTENAVLITDFINEVNAELKEIGRRAIVWGDMFLYRRESFRQDESYTCFAPGLDVERFMLTRLSRDVVIADWQYGTKKAPVETALSIKEAGLDCLLCPWDRHVHNERACLDTVKAHALHGLLHTTWHTLDTGFYYLAMAAVGGYENPNKIHTYYETLTAVLARKVMPVSGNYEKAGFRKKQF